MNEINRPDDLAEENSNQLSSRILAALIIDAIIDAGLIDKKDAELAIDIAVVEIDIRKVMGDY